jgi:ergothioneine biosynthesis protein EgtB
MQSKGIPIDDAAARFAVDYKAVRAQSMKLAEGLTEADACVQSMPDASPAKWHLAHTTWFFETFLLTSFDKGYKPFDDRFNYLFNSYYESVGKRHARPNRGMLTRPTLQTVAEYRDHVDEKIAAFMQRGNAPAEFLTLLELGLHHEQQHQELLLTDILHMFAQNPIHPEYRKRAPVIAKPAPAPLGWKSYDGGLVECGHDGKGFFFDCEGPRHKVYLNPYKLGTRLITSREYADFIADGGYANPMLWLADGWATVKKDNWDAPLYWEKEDDGQWWSMTLNGYQPVDMDAPVTHVSFYEAQAFAAWAGARLATEFEWENAAAPLPVAGNFADSGLYRPVASETYHDGLSQMFDTWQWTSSAYMPYPGFAPAPGAVGEYNGKFMSSQFVLRGASCATPAGHSRATYRNFFYPHQRWQFTGIRLAKDVS